MGARPRLVIPELVPSKFSYKIWQRRFIGNPVFLKEGNDRAYPYLLNPPPIYPQHRRHGFHAAEIGGVGAGHPCLNAGLGDEVE